MRLVLNKAKKETVADYIHGAGVFGILLTIGIYIYLPLSEIVRSGKIGSVDELFPLYKALSVSFTALALSALLLLVSAKLKKDGTWIANTYEKLGPGILLIILIFSVCVILPLVGNLIEIILMK